jgi:hypothetical protein
MKWIPCTTHPTLERSKEYNAKYKIIPLTIRFVNGVWFWEEPNSQWTTIPWDKVKQMFWLDESQEIASHKQRRVYDIAVYLIKELVPHSNYESWNKLNDELARLSPNSESPSPAPEQGKLREALEKIRRYYTEHQGPREYEMFAIAENALKTNIESEHIPISEFKPCGWCGGDGRNYGDPADGKYCRHCGGDGGEYIELAAPPPITNDLKGKE